MNEKKFLIFFAFLLLIIRPLFGDSDSRVLIYFFENLTGEDQYTELMYKIPACIYKSLEEDTKGKRIFLIDYESLQISENDYNSNIWNYKILLDIARKKRIHEVIYGQFYIDDGKLVIISKVFLVESGIILDIGEDNREYYPVIRDLESRSIDHLTDCQYEKDNRVYKPPVSSRILGEKIKPQHVLNVSIGPLITTSGWRDYYPYGIFNDISLSIFPRMRVLPLGFGITTGIIIFEKSLDDRFVSSELFVLPIGGSIRYFIKVGGFFEGIILDYGFGIGISRLSINNDFFTSVDTNMKGSMGFVFKPFKKIHLPLKLGFMSLAYRESPINALFGEIGVMFY